MYGLSGMPVKIEFTVTEYDPGQPWVVVATVRDSVELANVAEFPSWARARWPEPRYAVRVVSGM